MVGRLKADDWNGRRGVQFEIEDEIFRNGTPSEDYLIEVGRRNMARMTAREMVLAELLPAPPDEDVVGHPLEQDPTYLAREERISAAMDTPGSMGRMLTMALPLAVRPPSGRRQVLSR